MKTATQSLTSEEAQKASSDKLLQQLGSSLQGLRTTEAQQRLSQYGPNELAEKTASPLKQLFSYFWGPIPWMIEIAAILSLIVRHWDDFFIIFALLMFNAGVGFWQERKASNALEALKKHLALQARVLRDGHWLQIAARLLVPGDIIRVRLGDVIPADSKLLEGEYLSVDQSSLTGESLPVTKRKGDLLYAGSIAKQGEVISLVTATGAHTYFGRTAGLVQEAKMTSHFQKAILHIGDFLIYLSLALVAVLFLVQIFRGAPLLSLIQFALILTVASIPVAMPAVLSVTMAVGALSLSQRKAIVTHLESIEEMAGIDILCSDKTGTLTQNKLTLGEPAVVGQVKSQDVILAGALASRAENNDPLDLAVIAGLKETDQVHSYHQQHFMPFDPVHKRTEATIEDAQGKTFKVSKGAPQVMMALAHLTPLEQEKVTEMVRSFAEKGYRTLGVTRADEDDDWHFLGILPLFDPPRTDSVETIAQAQRHGITVKMVTGDNTAIACEIAGQLGLGQHIQAADVFFSHDTQAKTLSVQTEEQIEQADGFAQVFPEHKYAIVKALQRRGHLVGMTGDGVNDAPALKQADVGIAVSGATDAARAAADLVLTEPGLSTIMKAVEEARRIFERMNSYAIYRIIETIRIMFFVVLAMIIFNFYPITAIMIILLAFFNDLPIMTIAFDNTWLDPQPTRWNMHRVLRLSTLLGLIGVAETFGILFIARVWLALDIAQIQTFIFLKLAVAGHMTLFVARTRKPLWTRPYPSPWLLWSAIGTKVLATAFVIFPFGLIAPITWVQAGMIWAYCILWIFLEDGAKLHIYRHMQMKGPRHQRFLTLLNHRVRWL